MQKQVLQFALNISVVVAFISGVLLITGKTWDYRELLRYTFYVSGGLVVVLQVLKNILIDKEKDFNYLFWIGSIVIFAAVILKTIRSNYSEIALLVGAGITGLSYFVNPFNKSDDEEEQKDQLLDS